MQLIGLAGPARVGKDSIADYLVEQHDFLKFAFSDALYDEVQGGYHLIAQTLLREAATKEEPTPLLAINMCADRNFIAACVSEAFGITPDLGGAEYSDFLYAPRSPRWVLQRWGTEYRRAQDPNYWIKKSNTFIETFLEQKKAGALPEIAGLVNTTVRFENELAFIDKWHGQVWHIYRRAAEAQHLNTYVSEMRLPVRPQDKELHNNGSLESLNTGVTLLLGRTRRLALES